MSGAALLAVSSPSLAEKTVDRFFQWALLGMLASGFAAVLGSGNLDWPASCVMLLALTLRALSIPGWISFHVPVRWVAILSVLYTGFYPLDYLLISQSFLTATVHMICFVAAVKILTATSERDYTFVKLVATLELLAAALLSISLTFFVCLAAFLLCTIATFASGEVHRSLRKIAQSGKGRAIDSARVSLGSVPGFPRRLGWLSASLFVSVLTLTAGMFFVLPRTARAAFQRYIPQRSHLPGFANEVTLGEMGELKQNSTPVMHVRSYQEHGVRTDLSGVHWRGSALVNFDGKRWFNSLEPEDGLPVTRGELVLPQVRGNRVGRVLGYEIQLDEIASETLVFAGVPETISIQSPVLRRSRSGTLRAPRFGNRGLRYGAYSFLQNDYAEPEGPPAPLTAAEREDMLALPNLDSRIAQLARQWTEGKRTAEEQARAVENHLRHDFSYSLKMLDAPVDDPLANFLFVRKQGHCEYFASAMAVMLRSVGIPSRVATGFYGGVFNSMTGWQVVRASDAHSWVEAWLPSRGWTTFDPTPPDTTSVGPEILNRAALFFDTADQFWRDWVMDYDLDHQVVLASQLQAASRNFRLPAALDSILSGFGDYLQQVRLPANGRGASVVGIVAAIALLGAVAFRQKWMLRWRAFAHWRRVQRGYAQPADATLVYQRALHVLARHGFQKPPWLTPDEFARVLPSSDLGFLAQELTVAYNQVRFGGSGDAAPRLARLLQSMEALATK